MRTSMLVAGAVALAVVAGTSTLAQQAQGQGGQGQNQARREGPPTVDAMRTAVSRLEKGRIRRPTSYDELSAEQKKYISGILEGPRASISGPLGVMLVSPGMGTLVQQAMAYSRFSGTEGFASVPPKFNELGILMVARAWTAQYVWNAHNRYAVSVGLPQDVVDAIRAGKRPAKMDADTEAIYTFADELINKKKVSGAALDGARKVLGSEKAVVDLVGTMGMYQITSMLVTVDELMPANAQSSLPPLP